MTEYIDCMVDLETTSTLPDRGAIIQVAAVKFNMQTGEVSHEFFDRCMNIPPHRHWDEGTRHWWMRQKKSVLQGIYQRMEDPATVWDEFCDWAYPAGSMRFWSKPTHFDFNFVSSYCNDFQKPNPFHFRIATDMNSFLRGLWFPHEVPDLQVPFKGNAHNALHDTLHQVKVLLTHKDEAEKSKTWLQQAS